MKQLSTLAFLLLVSVFGHAQSITAVNLSWSPQVLTVAAGTPIDITFSGNHHMLEVSQATWDADGTTSNGGFDYLAGTHVLTLTVPGTYWYVCVEHVDEGMKGRIIVEGTTGVPETAADRFMLFPNPAANEIAVTAPVSQGMQVALIDSDGREVLRRSLSGTTRIGIAHLAAGCYTAVLLNTKGVITERQRIVITR